MQSLFKVLQNASTELSEALTKINQGDVVNGVKNGLLAFAFRDSAGNAIAPQLNAEGALPVTFDAGTTLRESSKVLKASLVKDVEELIATITLTVTKSYTSPSIIYSCYRDIKIRVALVDDAAGTPVETNLYEGILGGAEIYEDIALKQDVFNTIGGTGVQELRFYATPLEVTSDIFVNASINEVA
jgi:hypothetical protein